MLYKQNNIYINYQVDGDACELPDKKSIPLLGISPSTPCSDGYECVRAEDAGHVRFLSLGAKNGVCKKKEVATTRKYLPTTYKFVFLHFKIN